MRQVVGWLMVAASLVVRGPEAAAAPPADVLAYGAFGIARVRVGAGARVTGDVGCLFDEVALGPGARVAGAAAAPTVRVRERARVTGGFFCSALEGADAACEPLPNPLVGGPTIVLAQPGVLDVSAPPRTQADDPLPAGAYGVLTLGVRAQVLLAGGSYHFEAIDVQPRARLLCVAACDVTVRTAVTVGRGARLGLADGAPGAAVVRVAGHEVATAFAARRRAVVTAAVYAPSADVTVGAEARVTGGVVGNRVTIGARARVSGPAAG